MCRALQLILYQSKISGRQMNWPRIAKWLIRGLIAAIIACFLWQKTSHINSPSFFIIYCVITLAGILYTLFTSLGDWFSSEDAFYLTTAPLKIKEMYYYHLLFAIIRFIKTFWFIIFPVLFIYSVQAGGPGLVLINMAGFILSLSLAINIGWFIMFYLLKKRTALRLIIVFILGSSMILLCIFLNKFPEGVGINASLGLLLLVHLFVPVYISRVFYDCLDSAGLKLNLRLKSNLSRKLLLHNKWLNPVYRSVLYKEILLDRRNPILYGRYILTGIILVSYIFLYRLPFFQKNMLIAVLYGFVALVLFFHEGFPTVYSKEGERAIYLMPHPMPPFIGLAKLSNLFLLEIPLVLGYVIISSICLSLAVPEAIYFTLTLLTMSMAHLSSIVAFGSVAIADSYVDASTIAGMIYEHTMGGFNSRVIMVYMASSIIPGLIISMAFLAQKLFPNMVWWKSFSIFNLFALASIVSMLYIGRRLLNKSMNSFMEGV